MESVKVKIEGIAPLLMNKYPVEQAGEKKAKRKDEVYTAEKDAAKAVYREDGIGCYAPSEWIEACLRESAKTFKPGRGRGTMKATVLASVIVEPLKISLHKDTWDDIDVRPVVIQRQRIPKGRPKFNSWELSFEIKFDGGRIDKDMLRDILVEAGATKGIGDYRPKFGRFKVVEFE